MKKALILGINGQDGSYLSEILLEKGYEVHGLIRRTSTGNLENVQDILQEIELHYGDLSDPISLYHIIRTIKPVEIYNEADQDHAGISFQIPAYNFDITGSAVGRILEIIKQIREFDFFNQSLQICLAKLQLVLKMRILHLTPKIPMHVQKPLPIICLKCIEMFIQCMFQLEYFITMNLHDEQMNMSLAK